LTWIMESYHVVRVLRYSWANGSRYARFKTQTVSLGEPVTFEGEDVEQFLREIKDGPSPERLAELRSWVAEARAVKSDRSANELFR